MSLNRDFLQEQPDINELISLMEIIYLRDSYFDIKNSKYLFRCTHEKLVSQTKQSMDSFIGGFFSNNKTSLNAWNKIISKMNSKPKKELDAAREEIKHDLTEFLNAQEFLQPFIGTLTDFLNNTYKEWIEKALQLKKFPTINLEKVEENINLEKAKLSKHLPVNIQILNESIDDLETSKQFLLLYNETYGNLDEEQYVKNLHLLKQQLPQLEKKAQAIKKQYEKENNIVDILSTETLPPSLSLANVLKEFLTSGNQIVEEKNQEPEIKKGNLQKVLINLKKYIKEQPWEVNLQMQPYYMEKEDGTRVRIPKHVALQLDQIEEAIKEDNSVAKENLYGQMIQIGLDAAKKNNNLLNRFFRRPATKDYYASFNDIHTDLIPKPAK